MKILIVCGAGYISGLEVVTLSVIQGLRERGHEVKCITSWWGNGDFARRLDALSIPYKRMHLGFISKTVSWTAIQMTLDQLRRLPELWVSYWYYKREFNPDIILQTNFHHIFLLWPLLHSDKTIYHVHNYHPPTKFYRYLFRFLNRRLSAFIGVSRFISNSVVQLGIPKQKVFSVHNGSRPLVPRQLMADLSCSFTPSKENKVTSTNKVVIGIVGQIGEWKGHDDLVEALRQLKEWDLPFCCAFFGTGQSDYVMKLKNKIEYYNLTAHIQWMGFVENIEEIFSSIDICVVPSRFQEPFGMVASEAAHFALPVVATRQGGLTEIVQHGKTGYLVDAQSPEQLAEKLKLLIIDSTLRKKIGIAARNLALHDFTQSRMIEDLESIFRQSL